MPKFTNEDREEVKEKLEYIGLDLENLPEIISNPIPIELKESLEKENRVFKYIPVDKIQIWVTPRNREVSLKDRVEKALPLIEFLNPEEDKEMERYAEFIRMLSLSSEAKIEEIDALQKLYFEEIPFEVRYERSFLWQIYYSESNDLYYMLVPGDHPEYNEMFYVIKKQIEFYKNGIETKIYVPVSNLKFYSDILKKQEIIDIEKYLWLFTKTYPTIYEVYENNNNVSMHVVGETICFDKIKSKYKNVLKDQTQAGEFYRLIKALFILQTEMNYYQFSTRINDYGEIQFFYNDKQITYSSLPDFIKEEYVKFSNSLNNEQEEKRKLRKTLSELKSLTNNLEKEYLIKQKEIATYLKYKRSLIGRIRFFLKPKINIKNIVIDKENEQEEKETMPILKIKIEKSNYTIEDLIELFNTYKKETSTIKNLNLDIDALNYKNKALKKKNENATLYINEINEHKKSIFEFWKFTNKDEKLVLEAGTEVKETEHKLKKTFEYETDIEELGINLDRIERNSLTKDEQDAVFLADTELLKIFNLIKTNKEDINEKIVEIKEKLINESKENEEEFDIFGAITEDRDKIKELANKKHREIEKNEAQIMKVTQDMSNEDFFRKYKGKS